MMKKAALGLALIYISIISIIYGADSGNSPPCSGDWIPYKDEKCVKLFKSFVTRHQAEELCYQQISPSDAAAPSLVTIKSAAEQKFLTEYVFNSSDSNNIWIGAERRLDSSTEFVWISGSPVQRFAKWAIGHPTENVGRRCVHMRTEFTRALSDMEWVDVSCNLGNWFICQKLQAWPIEQFQRAILSVRREFQHSVDDLTDQMTEMRSNLTTQLRVLQEHPVPIGFIYVQLSGQPEPRNIWPTVSWIEITSEYAGLFFRAVGGGSSAFGSIQEDASPRLAQVNRVVAGNTLTQTVITANNGFSSAVSTGATTAAGITTWGLQFVVRSTEVRPRNSAIRIWRRNQ